MHENAQKIFYRDATSGGKPFKECKLLHCNEYFNPQEHKLTESIVTERHLRY